MSVAIDQANIGTNNAAGDVASIGLTTTQNVASSGFIVLTLGWVTSTTTLSSVSGGGLTWTIDKQGNAASPSGIVVAIVSAQAPSGLASGTSLTASFAGLAGVPSIGGTSFTGVKTSSPVDGTPTGPTGAVATGAWSTPSYAIAAGSVIVAVDWNESTATGNTPTAPSLECYEIPVPGNPSSHVAEYRIEASSGSYTVAGAWGASTNSTNIAVAYLAAAVGNIAWIRA